MPSFNREKLKNSHHLIWLSIDFLMLGLLNLNLALIIFDSIYRFTAVQRLMVQYAPGLKDLYQPIHENFLFFDLIFVAIFLGEFLLRWGYAVKANIHDRWYFYPFIHWYDLVGCIPVGSFRVLRLLRVISIIHRLHQHNVIDVTGWRIYRFVAFYYDAFMEELSDRIVIKVLSGVQDEVKQGSPLFRKIQQDIVQPRRSMISEWLSDRIARASAQGYIPNRDALRSYLETHVESAMKQNQELSRLRYLPAVGPTIQETLEESVGDIVATVIHKILADLASGSNHAFIEDIVNSFLPSDPESDQDEEAQNEALIQLIVEILEATKDQVAVKHWRANLP